MHSAYTEKPNGGGIRKSIITKNCFLCDFTEGTTDPLNKMPFDGLWDTGASATVITQRVVDYLALSPISKTKVHDSSGERISDVYSVTLLLPSMRINIPMVIIGILPGFDLLIGMDVITLGDFSITNKNGNTVFSFRMPSQKHIDYVEESRIEDLRSKKGGFRQKR